MSSGPRDTVRTLGSEGSPTGQQLQTDSMGRPPPLPEHVISHEGMVASNDTTLRAKETTPERQKSRQQTSIREQEGAAPARAAQGHKAVTIPPSGNHVTKTNKSCSTHKKELRLQEAEGGWAGLCFELRERSVRTNRRGPKKKEESGRWARGGEGRGEGRRRGGGGAGRDGRLEFQPHPRVAVTKG